MPPVKNVNQLKQQSQNRNFLNSNSPEFRTVNQFTNKLYDLRDHLRKQGGNQWLFEKVDALSDNLMTIQTSVRSSTTYMQLDAQGKEKVNDAITGVTFDLPRFLSSREMGGEEKTGYQRLVEAGKESGLFTKEELDQTLDLVGKGMGVDLNVGDPEKERKKEEEAKEAQRKAEEEEAARQQAEAEQQAIIDAQANIALLENEEEQKKIEEEQAGDIHEKQEQPTDKWLQQHREAIKKNEGPYKPQGPMPDQEQCSDQLYLASSAAQVGYALKTLGVLKTGEEDYPPERNGAPSVFVMKDGKITSLREAGLWITQKTQNSTKGNPEFAKAVLRGEVFAYLPGERHPVQLQGTVDPDDRARMKISHSVPLNPSRQKLLEFPPEPPVSREPRWYHRAFKFWGNNRRICEEYAATTAARAKWQREAEKFVAEQSKAMPEADRIARDIEEKFGAQRTNKALQSELQTSYQEYRTIRQAEKEKKLELAKNKAGAMDKGISVMENVYAAKPKINEEWVFEGRFSSTGKLYRRNDFNKLSQADIDPASVKIGDKSLTEHEFAAIAMFGSLDPKLGVQAQKKSVGDPTAMLQGLQKDGYTQAEAEQMVSNSIRNAYTVDILHEEDRMNMYFETGVNGGRAKAQEALKAYPQDKTKLAAILADGIGFAAEMAGTTHCRYENGDQGIDGLVKLSGEMIDLAERDPELKEMVKAQYEEKEKAFCAGINKKIAPFAKDGKGLLKPKSFEEAVKDVRQYEKLTELSQKGLEATKALRQADVEAQTLPQDVKRGYIKDVLKANMVAAIYEKQHADRTNYSKSTGVNDGVLALTAYTGDMNMRIMAAEDEEEVGGKAISQGGGSSLPSNAPAIITSGTQNRFAEKPPVLQMISQPRRMEELDRQAEQIMEQDGLDKLDLEELNEKFYHDNSHPSPYRNDSIILRTAKLAEPQKAGPAQPQIQKQQELEQEQIQVDGQIV